MNLQEFINGPLLLIITVSMIVGFPLFLVAYVLDSVVLGVVAFLLLAELPISWVIVYLYNPQKRRRQNDL